MNYTLVNPALETLLFGIYIEALENGTDAEQHIIKTAFDSMHIEQEPLGNDDSEDFRGFNVGQCEYMRIKFADLRLTRTFFRAIRRELISNMPQIYLNESGDHLELPNAAEEDDSDLTDGVAAGHDTARVKIIRRNYGLYHSLIFIFATKRDRKPFLVVQVNINTDEYTTLLN